MKAFRTIICHSEDGRFLLLRVHFPKSEKTFERWYWKNSRQVSSAKKNI